MAQLTLSALREAVSSAAAFRCRTRLQPAGGPGDKVFPPTYAGALYAMEMRRVENELVRCVLMDSVQSQANRMEEALQDAVDEGRIKIPVVDVDFSNIPVVDPDSSDEGLYEPIGRIGSLEAPHRIADAILRDSELNGVEFRKTAEGRKITRTTTRNATSLLELCPTALVFGLWDSTGPKGGLGVKFQRAIVSEIIGVNAAVGVKTSSRIDPLAIQLKSGPVYEAIGGGWTDEESKAVKVKGKPKLVGKDGKPSEVNHGNIAPSLSEVGKDVLASDGSRMYLAGGVTIDYAEQTTVLSLPALRRLKFPLQENATSDREVNLAAQTALAALGICAASLAVERGLDLRSRCLLWPTELPVWELLGKPGTEPTTIEVDAENAITVLNEAIAALKKAGLPWREDRLTLLPSSKLVNLVRKSQQLAVQSAGGDGEEA